MLDKIQKFEQELKYIKNPQIKLFAENAIEILPDYFWIIPSSSSGKYHSAYGLGEGGLVNHVRACVRFAVECFRLEWYSSLFTDDQKDLILVALLLHDGAKSGIPKKEHTQFNHPILMTAYLRDQDNLKNIISDEYFDFILNGIASHMGAWNVRDGIEVMSKPKTSAQKLIHFVDYVCSRKMFEVNFDAEISRA